MELLLCLWPDQIVIGAKLGIIIEINFHAGVTLPIKYVYYAVLNGFFYEHAKIREYLTLKNTYVLLTLN